MYNDDQRYSYNSDADTTHGSMNFHNESTQQMNRLEDGTVEITDTLPKKEYYMSLRKGEVGSRMGGSMNRVGGSSAGFGTIRPGFFGQKSQSILDFKGSGKNMDCLVIMLDGSEEVFTVDRQGYGQHLFDMVCDHLELSEREYFGITFKDITKVWYWLDLSKKILKQAKDDRLIFEFQMKFYPPNIEIILDGLTRYYFCLQIRQDLVSGILPCSFYLYVVLGSYIIQSEAGDFDPCAHQGVDYIRDQPFAPQQFQTEELLHRIVEMHKMHRGQTPEEADKNFLDNAKKLALYGVDKHKVKTTDGEEVILGVYHGGLLVYRGRVRVIRFSWARLIKVSYKKRKILLSIREINKNDTKKEMIFKCKDVKHAKRLYQTVVDHHYFFRMIEFGVPKKPNLRPGFHTRKYYKNPASASPTATREFSYDRNPAPAPKIRRLPQTRKEQSEDGWYTLPSKDPSSSKAKPSSLRADVNQTGVLETPGGDPGPRSSANHNPGLTTATSSSTKVVEEHHFHHYPGDSHQKAGNNAHSSTGLEHDNGSSHTVTMEDGGAGDRLRPRPQLPPLHWRMCPADCSASLGMDERGLDVASQPGANWQGCRANKGVKAAGHYFYEARVLEDGLVRVGWSANDASLSLGSDAGGFGYGADDSGAGWQNPRSSGSNAGTGRLVHGAEQPPVPYGEAVFVGDYIGCRLDMDSGRIAYYRNGHPMGIAPLPHGLTDPESRREPLFPAVSVRDGRVELNFGESAAFVYPPVDNDSWLPICQADDTNQAPNRRVGWKLNAYDASSRGLDVSAEGLMAQSHIGSGWKGARCNKGVRGRGKYYYEATPIEHGGLARLGWSTEQSNLELGSDKFGFGYGADPDGFGLTGIQGKKMFCNDIENYGKAFKKGDIIGCMLNLDEGKVQWSLNGEIYDVAYNIPLELRNGPSAFFPTASMKDNTLDFNFGEKVFKHYPGNEWIPLTYTPEQFMKDSRRKGPERKVKGWSYISPEDMDEIKQSAKIANGADAAGEHGGHVTKKPLAAAIKEIATISDDGGNTTNTTTYGETEDDNENNHPDNLDEVLISKTGTRTVTNGEVTEVHTGEPNVETEEYVDEHGNLVKRIVTKTKKITKTTKTMSELVTERSENDVASSKYGKMSRVPKNDDEEDEQVLYNAILAVTLMDGNATVLDDYVGSLEFVTSRPSIETNNSNRQHAIESEL